MTDKQQGTSGQFSSQQGTSGQFSSNQDEWRTICESARDTIAEQLEQRYVSGGTGRATASEVVEGIRNFDLTSLTQNVTERMTAGSGGRSPSGGEGGSRSSGSGSNDSPGWSAGKEGNNSPR